VAGGICPLPINIPVRQKFYANKSTETKHARCCLDGNYAAGAVSTINQSNFDHRGVRNTVVATAVQAKADAQAVVA
jgi:hypothetical protein